MGDRLMREQHVLRVAVMLIVEVRVLKGAMVLTVNGLQGLSGSRQLFGHLTL